MRKTVLALAAVIALTAMCMPQPFAATGTETQWADGFVEKIERYDQVPEGYIGIFDENDLMMIGSGADSEYDDPSAPGQKLKWTLGSNYIQMSDIDLVGTDVNGGFSIKVTSIPSGQDVTFIVQDDSGGAFAATPGVRVWFNGTYEVTDGSGTVTFSGRDDVRYAVIVNGTIAGSPLAVAFDLAPGDVQDDVVLRSNGNVDPIGSSTAGFSGTYDGNGHIIKGMEVSGHSGMNNETGLFGYADGALIRNIGIEGGTAVSASTQRTAVGGIVGYSVLSSVVNCRSSVSVYAAGDDAYAGGLIGMVYNVSGSVTDDPATSSYNDGTVNVYAEDAAYAGGISGGHLASGYVTNCYNTGDVVVTAKDAKTIYAGGISGTSNSGAISSFNIGDVNVTVDEVSCISVGGIAGTSNTIYGCYNTGNMTSTLGQLVTQTIPQQFSGIGGITGMGHLISECYSTGEVHLNDSMSEDSYIGGIVGHHDAFYYRIVSSYYLQDQLHRDGAVFGDTLSSDPRSAADAVSGSMDEPMSKDPAAFGWDMGFDQDWNMIHEVNDGRPYLTVFSSAGFIVDPASQSVSEGDEVTFTASASSSRPISYKWQRSADGVWTDIPNSAGKTLTLRTVISDDGAAVRCIAYSDLGAAVSGEATVSVTAVPGPPSGHDDMCWKCDLLKCAVWISVILLAGILAYAVYSRFREGR